MDHSDTLPPDIFAVAVGIARDLPARVQPANRDFAANVIARAILAERKRAIAACEAQREAFRSTEYAFNQPLGSLLERFACDQCIEAIRGGQS